MKKTALLVIPLSAFLAVACSGSSTPAPATAPAAASAAATTVPTQSAAVDTSAGKTFPPAVSSVKPTATTGTPSGGTSGAENALAKAAQKLKEAKSLHFEGKGTMVFGSSKDATITFEAAGDAELPDKIHQVVTIKDQTGLLGNVTEEVIALGGKTWTRTVGVTDWAYDENGGGGKDSLFDPREALGTLTTDIGTVVSQEKTNYNGQAATHYTLKTDLTKAANGDPAAAAFAAALVGGFESTSEVWIADSDSSVLRQTMTATIGILDAKITMDLQYSKYGQKVSPPIQAP